MPAGKFRPVVQSQARRVATLSRDHVEHSRHPAAGEAGVHLQPKALPRKRLADDQPSDLAGELQDIVDKIQRPLLVRRRPRHQRLALPHAMLPFSPAYRQTALPVQPMHSLVVYLTEIRPQHQLQPPIHSQMAVAALGRQDVPEADRRDFYLYADEFTSFTTSAFA